MFSVIFTPCFPSFYSYTAMSSVIFTPCFPSFYRYTPCFPSFYRYTAMISVIFIGTSHVFRHLIGTPPCFLSFLHHGFRYFTGTPPCFLSFLHHGFRYFKGTLPYFPSLLQGDFCGFLFVPLSDETFATRPCGYKQNFMLNSAGEHEFFLLF